MGCVNHGWVLTDIIAPFKIQNLKKKIIGLYDVFDYKIKIVIIRSKVFVVHNCEIESQRSIVKLLEAWYQQ